MSALVQITVQRGKEQHDIEVSSEIAVSELIETVVHAYGWDQISTGEALDFKVRHILEDRGLDPAETLLQARVWNGALIGFHSRPKSKPVISNPQLAQLPPKQEPATLKPIIAASANVPSTPAVTPFSGWKPISIDAVTAENAPSETGSDSFTWKQMD